MMGWWDGCMYVKKAVKWALLSRREWIEGRQLAQFSGPGDGMSEIGARV